MTLTFASTSYTALNWIESMRRVVPDGFEIDAQGTYQSQPPKRGVPKGQVVRIASRPIVIAACARDANDSAWSMMLEYMSPDGQPRTLLTTAAEVNSRNPKLLDQLAQSGVLVDPGYQVQFRSYLFAAFSQPSLPRLKLVPRLGFQHDAGRLIFVLPGQTLDGGNPGSGTTAHEKILFEPPMRAPSVDAYHARGTLEEWQAAIAPFADHPVIVAAVLLGLAGPFAALAGVESGGLHFYGETSTGKSTALQACGSVSGCAADTARRADRATLFQRWNTTANAVEGMLAPHSGMTVTIDEVGSNDGQLNIYNMFSGQGKSRFDETCSIRAQSTWSVQMLSSGEYAMRDHIETVGQRRATGGQAARMLDIPTQEVMDFALAHGAPPLPPPEELGPLITQLKDDCAHFYGTALPSLVDRMLKHFFEKGFDLDVLLSAEVKELNKALCDEASARSGELLGPQRRALSRLALMQVIGHCAVELGVVPFTEAQVDRAVRAVRDAWLSAGTYASGDEQVLSNICNYVIRYIDDVRNTDVLGLAPAGGWQYFYLRNSGLLAFTEDQLKRASGLTNTVAVGKILDRAGWLHRNDNRQRCRTPAALRDLTTESRVYLISAQPVLGELFETLDLDSRSELLGTLADEDGVLTEG